jgi:hypothetical protein
VVQRTVLHLGELNTTQVERWQRTIEAIQEDGQRRQLRLFTDRQGQAPVAAEDVAEVIRSSLVVRRPRRFGDCWIGCKLWEDLGLRTFWDEALGEQRGEVPWAKVVELLVVNRLCDPRSELFLHEKWLPQTAMDLLLDGETAVAHKDALERHLAGKWRDLFGASFDVLLYDLTSTYFEGDAEGVETAARGYSRDHRPDCAQLVIAIVVTPEGFPLSYEVFDGNRADVTTLEAMLDQVEAKHGRAQRIWVFDRGIVSEANLDKLRERGGQSVVGTPRHRLQDFEQELLEGAWQQINESVQVQLIEQDQETYVLARSVERAKKEAAMRWRQIRGLMRDLGKLRRSVCKGTVVDSDKVRMRLGRLSERWPRAWHYVSTDWKEGKLSWHWDRQALRLAQHRDGAYLLRTNLSDHSSAALWRMYAQLTEVEAVFRALKSELALRPIWHWVGSRVEAHVMVAFLGYCLWVCLKQKLKASAPGLSPWQLLDQFQRSVQAEVWFKLKAGGAICLPRITQPEAAQAMILHQMNWSLPELPPPRIYQDQIADVWPT